jgi:hypothetical protein
MFHKENVVDDLKNSLTSKRAKNRPDPSHLAFVMSVLIVAIGLTLLSIASGVQIDPEVVILVHP